MTATLGVNFIIPTLRKLLTNNVDPAYFGAVYAVPALVEGLGFPVGGLVYITMYQKDPLNASWVFYGASMAFVAGLSLCFGTAFYTKKYLVDYHPEEENMKEIYIEEKTSEKSDF
jgi:hypothetical protein